MNTLHGAILTATAALAFGAGKLGIPQVATVPKVLRAESIELVGTDGTVQCLISSDALGFVGVALSTRGITNPEAILTITPDFGPVLRLVGKNGDHLTLQVSDYAQGLNLVRKDGEQARFGRIEDSEIGSSMGVFLDTAVGAQASLTSGIDGNALRIYNRSGDIRATLGDAPLNDASGRKVKLPTGTLTLIGENGATSAVIPARK